MRMLDAFCVRSTSSSTCFLGEGPRQDSSTRLLGEGPRQVSLGKHSRHVFAIAPLVRPCLARASFSILLSTCVQRSHCRVRPRRMSTQTPKARDRVPWFTRSLVRRLPGPPTPWSASSLVRHVPRPPPPSSATSLVRRLASQTSGRNRIRRCAEVGASGRRRRPVR